jgi:hypothetical protein
MALTQKSNSNLSTDSKWSSSKKPFNLNEVLKLRDGLELPRKTHPGFIAQRANPELYSNGWVVLSLN